jgi:hypothetical protein
LAQRIFSDEEERQIADDIRREILTPGTLFTNADFRALITDRCWARYEDVPWSRIKDFHASDGFVADFKARNRFSSRRAHYKRRPNVDPERCIAWQREIEDLLRTVDHDLILNADETSWCLYPRGVTTWASRGAENVVIGIRGDEKECLTVMATIRASGKKDPLYILAQGKTARVEESQIGDVGEHGRDHSESGWMTADTFNRYLDFIRGFVENRGSRIHLLVDVYPVHIQATARQHAEDLNIQLHFIPAGLTDEYQPLDRRVFGALKSSARGTVMSTSLNARGHRIEKHQAIQTSITAWDRLSRAVVLSGWNVYGHAIDEWGLSEGDE